MESSVFVVPDTNIFLHCKPLDELPWGLLATETVEILLVDPVLAELDHWKDQGNDRRAKRVRALLPMLRKLVADGHDVVDVAAGPPRVRLQLDSGSSKRSWEDNDGAIVDAAQAIQARGCSPVLVLTRDVLLAARCKRRGVTFMLLSPDDARWNAEPERPDPTLSEVRRELEELKRQRPVIEVELDTIGGRLTNEAIEVFLPRISSFERIDFATQWAVAYFEEHGPRNASRDWNLQDHGWKHDLFDLDAELRKALGTRLVGATMWLTVKNSGSVNAEDVRVELLAEGGWLLASETANLTIEVPRPPLQRIHDPNAIFVPPLPTFDFPTSHSADPSEPVWEVTETEAEWRGVSRLAVRIPVLRHRDEVEIPFRLGANEDWETPGRLIVRVSTENTPKPVVQVLGLVRDTQEFSVGALIDVLIEREELEISVASRTR